MDIKNMFDFEDKINNILNNTTLNTDVINEQGEYLDSANLQSTFNKIENDLNDIYEKSRVLEEAMAYAKSYINNEMSKAFTDCRNLLNEIENISDDIHLNTNDNYISYNVPLTKNTAVKCLDRDGTELKSCEYYNNIISMSADIVDDIKAPIIKHATNEIIYDTNIQDLNTNGYYRSLYLLDAVVQKGIIESISFFFNNSIEINYIKLLLSNCKINRITYIHEDNTETDENNVNICITSQKNIIGVRIELNCTNYVVKTVKAIDNSNNRFDIIDQVEGSNAIYVGEKDKQVSYNAYKNNICKELDTLYKGGK